MNGKARGSVFSVAPSLQGELHKGRRLPEKRAQTEAVLMNYLNSYLGTEKTAQQAKYSLTPSTRTRVQTPST